jgi:hypothetical protein
MKRFRLCIILLFAVLGLSLSAQGKSPKPSFPLTIDTFEGFYYNAQTIPTDIPSDITAILSVFQIMEDFVNNFRTGVVFDFETRLGKIGGFGGEFGAYYFVNKDADGNFLGSFLDIPYRLKLSLTAGRVFKTEIFGGVVFAMWFDSSRLLYYPYLDAGGRIALGPIYFEGSYQFPFGSEYEGFPRFGLGLMLPISR